MRVLIRHFGLGDGIELVGAAVILAKEDPLIFPCQEQDVLSFREIFKSVPNITVRGVAGVVDMEEIEGEPIHTGQFKEWPPPQDVGFDQWFYDQLGIPLEEKWNSFPMNFDHIPRDRGVALFLHEDSRRKYIIDRTLIDGYDSLVFNSIRLSDYSWEMPWQGPSSITNWAGPIIRAGRLDFINSGPFHFADQLPLRPEQPKFLHRYARPWSVLDMPKLKHNWQMLD